LVDFLATRHDVAPVALGVARLEWAGLQSLLSPDAPNVAELPLQLGPRFADCRLGFVPSLRALRVPVESLRAFAPAEPEARVSSSSSIDVVFSRPRFAVHHVALEPDEAQALNFALDRQAIGAVCCAFAELPEVEAVLRASAVLSSWFARRWVASCSL
jgi:hypothetical protein